MKSALPILILALVGCGDIAHPKDVDGVPFDLEEPDTGIQCSADVGVAFFLHMRGDEYMSVGDFRDIRYLLTVIPELITAVDADESEHTRCLSVDVVSLTPDVCVVVDTSEANYIPYPYGPAASGSGIEFTGTTGTCRLESAVRGTDGSAVEEEHRFEFVPLDHHR